MEFEVDQPSRAPTWPQLIRKDFDFKDGQGLAQLDVSHLFSSKHCQQIYQTFTSNLNWIIRDGQRLEIPDEQAPLVEYLEKIVDFFQCLLQQNIPEKNHIHLTLETFRIARSDGTQHQVGSRWHQDHEAYFTLIINLMENPDPNSSTTFFFLEPDENYSWDRLGNPTVQNHWTESFIKPLHVAIINSGIRHFLFPFDRGRPIVHRSPQLALPSSERVSDVVPQPNKRLAVIATFLISGVGQGMDLRDTYIPLLNSSTPTKQNIAALQDLKHYWRNILGIEKSIQTKNSIRRSKFEYGLSNLSSTKFTISGRYLDNQQNTDIHYRIVNFGLKQFEKEYRTKNDKLLNRAIPIGELSRTLHFFSEIGQFSFRKLIQTIDSPLLLTDCSSSGNNNYDLLVQFKHPQRAFQLLSMQEVLDHIDQLVLILYRGATNYIYPKNRCDTYQTSLPFEREKTIEDFAFTKKQLTKNRIAQIFTSFPLSESKEFKIPFLLSHSLEIAWQRGTTLIVGNNDNKYVLINRHMFNKKTNASKQYLRGIDEVPFFLPRTGINRTLQDVDLGSQLFRLSKKILCKPDSHQI